MAASIGYVFGLNEILVELVSNFFEIGIYEKIKYYSLDVPESGMGIYEGFVPVFFVYTIFWPLILMFALRLKAVGVSVNKYSLVVSFIRIYMIFSLPYFVFGFGPFSNRYSYIAWFIVPVMQLLVISMIKIRDELYVGILFFIVSLVYFIGYRLEMLRVFS